jgi:hypothetical protein
MIRLFGVAFVGVLATAAGIAAAGNLSSDREIDYYAAGQHQFYMWCPGGTDYLATQQGGSAEAAQMTLYAATKASGKAQCWPVWQGRAAG